MTDQGTGTMNNVLKARTLLTGLGFGESPRWHEGRLWFSNWGTQEVVATDEQGRKEVIVRVPTTIPFSIDWLLDGRLLVVSGPEGLVLRREPDGTLITHADLRALCGGCNEIVVDGRGNVYVNGGGFNLMKGEKYAPGAIALVAPDGTARKVADEIAFPNGMAVTADNRTLIIAESYGKRLTAFEIEEDGTLSNRRVWADLGDGVPDGICLDAEKAVWYADVPNKRCVRVREGGEVLQTVQLDRSGFACMLGGAQRKTLFIMAAEWHGPAKMMHGIGTGQVLAVEAPAAGAGWPGRSRALEAEPMKTESTKKARPKSVAEYVNAAPKEARSKLREMRECIRAAAPGAEEGLKWGMPAYSYQRILVTFSGHKQHIGFHPTPSAVKAFAKELGAFETADNSIRFSLQEPLPLDLVRRITEFRVKESLEKDKKWRT